MGNRPSTARKRDKDVQTWNDEHGQTHAQEGVNIDTAEAGVGRGEGKPLLFRGCTEGRFPLGF